MMFAKSTQYDKKNKKKLINDKPKIPKKKEKTY